jgi:branched-chain amino acid transport system ATP-binding protein/branched-chain amino acid transport system permease protein
MSAAYQYYFLTLITYFAVNAIACWSLNLQFGYAGVMNFAFIIFQAIGAYIAAVLALGKPLPGGTETYIMGWHLSWPLPILGATLAGALLAGVVGSFALRPRRRDFQATVMLVVSTMALTLVSSEQGWFNGFSGLYAIPHPFSGALGLNLIDYGWFFVGYAAAMALVVYLFVHRITSSPWGRRLRAMRENAEAVESIGTNTQLEGLKIYMIGGALAAFSGAILVQFIGAWSPAAWGVGETFFIFAAVIVGGVGNNFGALIGAFLVLGVFLELPQYLPSIAVSTVQEAIQAAAIGVLILLFLWFRPKGVVPERRRKLAHLAVSVAQGPAARSTAHAHDTAATDVRARAEVRDLARDFGGVQAVDGVSFAVPQAQITGLIGPNGAGKSTVLKLIAGAIAPTRGQILVDGEDIAGRPQYRVARLGVVRTFQHTSEFPRLTVLENLLVAAPGQPGDSFGGALLGRRHARRRQGELLGRAYGLLEEFSLAHHADTLAGELSGGQRRLVEIMRALMAEPRILLLDEPMAGVNPTLRLTIEDHLRRLADAGLTMLMVEHELGAVERVCDSVHVMAQGRLLASGTMGDLRRNEEVIGAYLVG